MRAARQGKQNSGMAPAAAVRFSNPVARRCAGITAGFCLIAGMTACDGGAEPTPIINSPTAVQSESGSPDASPSPAPSTARPAALGDPIVTAELASGLGVPWAMALLPDGSLILTERETAEVKRIVDGEIEVLGVVEDAIAAGGEGGLLGVAVPPDFPDEPRLYLYYTSPTDNRVVSMAYSEDGLDRPQDVLTGIPKASIHNGGRIKFGPDGYLYIGTGDASDAESAQDRASLGGKILRIRADGEPAPDNPFGSSVYSLGHRNVQGLAWDSAGRLWASEFGPDRDDELNLVVPGGNYGWPAVTGAPGDSDFLDASVVWPSTATSSPSGMAILDDVAYIGGLRGERLWRVPVTDGSPQEPSSFLDGTHGRLRDTIAGTDGGLLIATNEDGGSRILQVRMQ
ncbi:sorbosone dehydrogenase family protein [uncultured Arthrobacter sp.]|uniref:PQQ-dependent sugar dehydrogenase n=1 Tax=uncultured Arthrobacter sp. TaxID=114050 RepID=UPI0026075863|nr:PQQ-dependent sugar dehydrogenase [uncultured Arthrobacter sp.]